ncbi:hypothetical protein MASR2M70_22730 [Bacillota bacterium]
MKFNKHISSELQELLITQLKEYIKTTPMTRKELRAVRDWVKDGHSVYESMSGAFYDGQTPVEFLAEWRDDEYISQHTKWMAPEEARRFALSYYGRDDENVSMQQGDLPHSPEPVIIEGEVLLFR